MKSVLLVVIGIVLLLGGWALGFYCDVNHVIDHRAHYWLIGVSTGITGALLMVAGFKPI